MVQGVFVSLIMTGVAATVTRLASWWSSRPSSRGGEGAAPADSLRLRLSAVADLVWAVLLLAHFVFLAVLSDAKEIVGWLANLGTAIALAALVAAVVSLWGCARHELQAARSEHREPRT